ncbi:radical SAM family heme chaperone HemW [Usitatibacter palustris]|uniref:Heme chaperone HemW n=1 Tax=Usitatibacter palustris TaxID=2732487 RepID=A0A6M4H3L8_9PROT|nr:radical SAM family heme chaperone HemW [Usitatibacter palustris]QJR13303.1 Heme chaperone HemW [Usitatibacter palustris]
MPAAQVLADLTRPRFAQLPPLSLYVHIPWCLKKCPYCDFNSHEKRGDVPEARYVQALVADLESALPQIWGRRFSTIFIGGGTPSLFTPQSIDAILTAVRTRVPVDPDAEITLEANPGTFEAERFRGYRAAGVSRLSIGVQSFDDAKLAALGRVHGSDEARRAIATGLEVFGNVNIDLMYALPGQSIEEALADVKEAIAFDAPHISAYHLTLEPNTYFHSHPPKLPDDDLAADMQEAIEAVLAAGGYEHYETSAFAKPGRRARHNVNYWTFGDYVGIGAGAHGKITFADRVRREARQRQPAAYMDAALAGDALQEGADVSVERLPFEFMLNALRLTGGVPATIYTERTGLPITTVGRELRAAEERGLLEKDPTTIRPTSRGQRFLNELLEMFLPAEPAQARTIALKRAP